MKTISLDRDDIRTDLHPRLWEDICDQLGIGPARGHDDIYPESVVIYVADAKAGF